MAKLPRLPATTRRLYSLRWQKLIKEYGFNGDHLRWHESPGRRREAAKPAFSLKPPPPPVLQRSGRSVTYRGSHGEPISYEDWKREQMAAWGARENDPKVVDSIAIAETIGLAKARFADVARDYLTVWADVNGTSDEFMPWLKDLAVAVRGEVGDLWGGGEWHRAWFDRACGKQVEESLMSLAEEWGSRASELEIQHLENPHLSLRSLVDAGGDVESANKVARDRQAIVDRHQKAVKPLSTAQAEAVDKSGLTPEGHERVNWEDVKILFLSDERARLQVREGVETRNYAEMGFEDRRNGKPNQGWHLLRALAVNKGVLTNTPRNAKEFIATEKGMERVRKGLQKFFGITSDPIPRQPKEGYTCRFKIGCAPSFGADLDLLGLY